MSNTTTNHIVNVATEPDENAPTFEQVTQGAERAAEPFIDSVTPEGHFGVTVRNIGGGLLGGRMAPQYRS